MLIGERLSPRERRIVGVGAVLALVVVLVCVSVVAATEVTAGQLVALILVTVLLGGVGWLRWQLGRKATRAQRERMVEVPGDSASVSEMLDFGRTTYRGEVRHTPDELRWIAARADELWRTRGLPPDSTDVCRAALYATAMQTESEVIDAGYVRALVARIRRFAPDGLLMPDVDGFGLWARQRIAGVRRPDV